MHHRIRHWLDRGPAPIEPLHLATAAGRHVVAAAAHPGGPLPTRAVRRRPSPC